MTIASVPREGVLDLLELQIGRGVAIRRELGQLDAGLLRRLLGTLVDGLVVVARRADLHQGQVEYSRWPSGPCTSSSSSWVGLASQLREVPSARCRRFAPGAGPSGCGTAGRQQRDCCVAVQWNDSASIEFSPITSL